MTANLTEPHFDRSRHLDIKPIHLLLGYSGLIPFFGLAYLHVGGWPMALPILLGYATLILSFLGGSLWMASIVFNLHCQAALFSNLIMLLSWVALMLHASQGILIMVSTLMALLLFFELWQVGNYYHKRYMKLRIGLTFGAIVSLVMASVLG